jgi:cysteine-rich repeat protein
MARILRMASMAGAAVLFATVGVERPAWGAAPTALLVPQSTAFSVLGHSCGGIQEQAFATGFDATSGFPTGDVYLQTRCGGSGRGGGYHTTTYSAWIDVTWDFTGTVVSSAVGTSAPANVYPPFSAFDSFGNEVQNVLNVVNGASCTVDNTTYCAYRASLILASTFAPPPRVTSVSVTAGPVAGGTSVTVTGTGFTGATAVSFGATPAATPFTVDGDTSITAVSPPANAGTVDITVTTAGGTSATSPSDQFTFVAIPTVSGISPAGGPVSGGTLVTITGTSFIDVASISFGDTPAGFTVNGPSSITAVSPAVEAPDTVDVTVVTVGGTSLTTAADQFTYGTSTGTPTCGDGMVDPGEQCDDGAANGQPGDCCTVTCTFQPAGTVCADDGNLCTADRCDGAGTCTHPAAPAATCTPPDLATGASLHMQMPKPGRKPKRVRNQTQFIWGKGPAVPLADFGAPGDPPGGDLFELCVYDQTAPGSYALVLSGSPSVSGGGVWTAKQGVWKFKNSTGLPNGIVGATLKAGTTPLKAKVQMKAASSPSFGPLPLRGNPSVIAQVRSSLGPCWGATFSKSGVNTGAEFKAKSD